MEVEYPDFEFFEQHLLMEGEAPRRPDSEYDQRRTANCPRIDSAEGAQLQTDS